MMKLVENDDSNSSDFYQNQSDNHELYSLVFISRALIDFQYLFAFLDLQGRSFGSKMAKRRGLSNKAAHSLKNFNQNRHN